MKPLRAKPRSPLLASFIKSFHYHESGLSFMLERIMPNGQAHLMVNLAENEFRTYNPAHPDGMSRHSGAVLAGPHARSTVLDTREQCWLVAAEFRSGGAAPFFLMPLTDACNQVVPLDDLWRSSGKHLRERLLEAPTPALKFSVLEEVLLQHCAPKFDPAIQYAVTALQRGMPLAELTANLGWMPRTLARRFSSQVGITPKRYARVQRLQRLLRSARRSSNPDWSALAAEHGYTDQSHMVHDFRELADITPSAYRPQSPQRNNHIPVSAF